MLHLELIWGPPINFEVLFCSFSDFFLIMYFVNLISLLYFVFLIILNRYIIFIVHFQIVLLTSTLWSGSPVSCNC